MENEEDTIVFPGKKLTAGYKKADLNQILECVMAEFNNVTARYGNKGKRTVYSFMEESGEVIQALNDLHANQKNVTSQEVFNELVQAISQGLRVAIFGDRDFEYKFDKKLAENFKATSIGDL